MQAIKRKLLAAIAVLPTILLTACKVAAMGQRPSAPAMSETQRRFKDMGLILVVDAVEGAEMLGVEFYADQNDLPFYSKSTQKKQVELLWPFPSMWCRSG